MGLRALPKNQKFWPKISRPLLTTTFKGVKTQNTGGGYGGKPIRIGFCGVVGNIFCKQAAKIIRKFNIKGITGKGIEISLRGEVVGNIFCKTDGQNHLKT
jgi:hypothetical protein